MPNQSVCALKRLSKALSIVITIPSESFGLLICCRSLNLAIQKSQFTNLPHCVSLIVQLPSSNTIQVVFFILKHGFYLNRYYH